MKDEKLARALELLNSSLKMLGKDKGNLVLFAGTVKAFETSFEYAWKYLKREADSSGAEVYNPRESIKAAAQMGLIEDLDLWLEFLNARNLSVHDYIGISNSEFLPLIRKFETNAKKLLK